MREEDTRVLCKFASVASLKVLPCSQSYGPLFSGKKEEVAKGCPGSAENGEGNDAF